MPRRKTNEEFRAEVKALVGDEYIFLDKYVNSQTEMRVKHNIPSCNHIYQVVPNNFLRGRRCPFCKNKRLRSKNAVSNDDFKRKIKSALGNEYIFLDKYVNSRTKIRVKHNVPSCGLVYETTPNNFYRGMLCPKCKLTTNSRIKVILSFMSEHYRVLKPYTLNRQLFLEHLDCNRKFQINPSALIEGKRCPYCSIGKKDDIKFKSQVKELVGNDYVFLDSYINSTTKLRVKHTCGFVYKVTPKSFLRGNRCPECAKKHKILKLRYDEDKFRSLFLSVSQGNYKLLSRFEGMKSQITVMHEKCGRIYNVQAYSFVHGSKCKHCMDLKSAKKGAKTQSVFTKEVSQINDEYVVLGKYHGNKVKIKMMHKLCRHIFYMRPNNFLDGQRCPFCKMSKGEKAVIAFLEKNKIKYVSQYKIGDCKDKMPLPFDFAIFNANKSLNCLIEYQGCQHFFSPFSFKDKMRNFTLDSVLSTQKHDVMKLQYCKEHGIKLIRINHPQTSAKSNSMKFIKRLVKRTLDRELKVN